MNDGESVIFLLGNACSDMAKIPYIVGPSCTDDNSCRGATIGSVDSSCNGYGSCRGATIGSAYKSCTEEQSCFDAQIGSVDSSCKDRSSCQRAQLSGVDLTNSCNADVSCSRTNADGAFTELNECCNEDHQCCSADFIPQCSGNSVGSIIVAAGCVSNCLLYSLVLIAASLFVKYLTFFIHVTY